MALFGTKKKTEKVEKVVAKAVTRAVVERESKKIAGPAVITHAQDIILRPRITEKSGIMNEKLNVYTFEVAGSSTKHSIEKAIKNLYKVTPLKVRTVSLPSKKVFNRGHFGVKPSVKKALVYLKKGDKIEFA